MRKYKMIMWCMSQGKKLLPCPYYAVKNNRILHLTKGTTTLSVGMYCGCVLYNVWLTNDTMLTLTVKCVSECMGEKSYKDDYIILFT